MGFGFDLDLWIHGAITSVVLVVNRKWGVSISTVSLQVLCIRSLLLSTYGAEKPRGSYMSSLVSSMSGANEELTVCIIQGIQRLGRWKVAFF